MFAKYLTIQPTEETKLANQLSCTCVILLLAERNEIKTILDMEYILLVNPNFILHI